MLNFEEVCCECGQPATGGFFLKGESFTVCGREHFLITVRKNERRQDVMRNLLSDVKSQTKPFVLHHKDQHMTITSQVVTSEIGPETHKHAVQSIILLDGEIDVKIGSVASSLKAGDNIVVPMNAKHTIINKGKQAAKILSFYAFPATKYSPH